MYKIHYRRRKADLSTETFRFFQNFYRLSAVPSDHPYGYCYCFSQPNGLLQPADIKSAFRQHSAVHLGVVSRCRQHVTGDGRICTREKCLLSALLHPVIGVHHTVEILCGQTPSGGHNGKLMRTVSLILSALRHNFIRRQKGIHLCSRMIVRGLRTKFAVFTASARAAVDNRTQIHPISAQRFTDAVRRAPERIQISVNQNDTSSLRFSRLPRIISSAICSYIVSLQFGSFRFYFILSQ